MKVAVLMGSASDKAKMAPASEMLAQLGVDAVEEVMSAHRTPEVVAGFAAQAREMGYGAIICGAGMAAHLAGAVAARTTLPVIGVPLSGSALSGVDALYATVQMPRGSPSPPWPSTGPPTPLCWRLRSWPCTTRRWPNAWPRTGPASPSADRPRPALTGLRARPASPFLRQAAWARPATSPVSLASAAHQCGRPCRSGPAWPRRSNWRYLCSRTGP